MIRSPGWPTVRLAVAAHTWVLLDKALGVDLPQGIEVSKSILGLSGGCQRLNYRVQNAYGPAGSGRTIWLHEVPRRKRAVLGFSTALGARFSRARLERAFRGFLCG